MADLDTFVFGLTFGAPDYRNLRKAEKEAKETEKKREQQVKETGRRIARLRDQLRNTQDKNEKDQLRRQITNLRAFEKRAKDSYRAAAKEAKASGKEALKAAKNHNEAIKELRSGIGRGLGAVAGAGAAGLTGLAALTKHVAENGAELRRWSKTMDVSVEQLSALQEGFGLVAVPADNTREAVKTLRENLGELARIGTGPAKDALGSLGLELKDIDGLDAEDQMAVLADAIRDVKDPAKQLSIAIELMGEDGRHLLPVLRDGGDAVRELGQRARETGAVMSEDLVASAVDLDKNMAELRAKVEGAGNKIAGELVPALNDWFDENDELIDQNMAGIVDNISTAMRELIPLLTSVTKGFRLASEAATGLAVFADATNNDRSFISQIVNPFGFFTGDGVSGNIDAAAKRVADRRHQAEQRRNARETAKAFAEATTEDENAISRRVGEGLQAGQRGLRIANRSAFEAAELARTAGGGKRGGKRGGKGSKSDLEFTAEDFEADDLFGDELRRLAASGGVGDTAVSAAIKRAGKELAGGSAQSVARQAALRELGAKTGQDYTKTNGDPLLSEIFGDNVPDVELSKIARGAQPQTLVSNINNTFTFDIDQNISGAGSPTEVAAKAASGIRSSFEGSIEKSTKTATVKFVR